MNENNGYGYPNGNNYGGYPDGNNGTSYPGSPYSSDTQQNSYPGSPYSSGTQQNSYPGSPYSSGTQQNNYSGSPYSSGTQQNNYSGSPYSSGTQQNDFSGSPYSSGTQQNNYSGSPYSSGTQQYSSQNNFDPNAPLYDPSKDNFDPNAPLYHPEPSMYSQTGVAVRKKQNNGLVIAIVVVLCLALGFALYMYSNQKKSLKDFLETREGKAEMSILEDASKTGDDSFDLRWYTDGDNKLVLEYKYKEYLDLTAAEKKTLTNEMEKAMKKNEWQAVKSIDDMINTYKIEDFSILYDYKDASGTSLFQYEVFSSKHGKQTSV